MAKSVETKVETKEVSRTHRRIIRNVLNSYCVPNLIKSHRKNGVDIVQPESNTQWQDRKWLEDVAHFCRPLALGDVDAAQSLIDAKIAQNIPIIQIYKDYFPAAARLLGDMWLADDCSFAEVTIGVELLHRLVSQNAEKLAKAYQDQQNSGSILIASLANETHIFGASLMQTVYSAAKWDAETLFSPTNQTLLNAVKNKHYDVVAISLGDRKRLDECKLLLTKLRAVSLNSRIIIAVGGHVFDQNTHASVEVGADLQVTNIVDSLDQMKEFLVISSA